VTFACRDRIETMTTASIDTLSSRLLVGLLAAAGLSGCSCESQPVGVDAVIPDQDAAVDPDADLDGGPAEGPPAERFTAGDDGALDPLTIPTGQSRAGRLTASMLPPDVTGLGVWSEGDYVLASSAGFALLVEEEGVSDLYDRFGGRPVGIARVVDGTLTDAGDFNEILYGFSTFLTRTESVSVVADGADGGAAIVRVNGPLAPIDFAGEVLNVLRGSNRFEGFPSSMEYRMEPGADHVEVSMTIQNPEVRAQTANRIMFGVFQGNRMPVLNPLNGFDTLTGLQDYIAFADLDERTSWALVAPAGRQIRSELDVSGVTALSLERQPIAGCGRITVSLASIALGAGVNGAQAAAMHMRGRATREITGTVFEADGTTPVVGVHVYASVGSAWHTRTTTGEDGSYALDVPTEAVAVSTWRRGTAVSAPVMLAATDTSADVRLPPVGYIDVDATYEERLPLPVRVQVIPVSGDVLMPPASYGEQAVTGGRLHVDFTADGNSSLPVAPGQYDVIVSHGYEYGLHQQRVTVAAGERVAIDAILPHSVDTAGWMCADYHIHTTRSLDADDDAEIKVLGLVADGLEIPVRSEHEYADDFQPIVENLGLTSWAHSLAGEEITTWVWGHFGAFPLVVDDSMRNGNIPNVYDGALPPDAFAELRARPENPLLIINHPRQSGPGFGYFNVADYDPVTGMVGRADHWDEDFTVVEVINDSSFENNRDGTVVDWFSFLSRGRRVFAVGSSDSHRIYGVPVGYPRTCLDLGVDDPASVTPEMVRDATAAGRSYVSGGIYLDVTGPGGRGPGETVTGAGATASLRVRVQAADWIEVEELEIIVDGATLMTMPITAGADPVVRFEGDVTVPVAPAGSWVIVHARSSNDMQLLHPGREPFAVTNPIFLER